MANLGAENTTPLLPRNIKGNMILLSPTPMLVKAEDFTIHSSTPGIDVSFSRVLEIFYITFRYKSIKKY